MTTPRPPLSRGAGVTCDCPTRRIPGVPGFPNTDRHEKDHAADCDACRDCNDGYVTDANRRRWRCSHCAGTGRRTMQEAGR